MKKILTIGTLVIIVALAYIANKHFDHFINDKGQRAELLQQFNSRYSALEADIESANLTGRENEAVKWLYVSMPWSDAADYSLQFHIDNIKASFLAKEEMPWGRYIPEREFRHFVLPARVNNEKLDEFRKVYYQELKERVKGLNMQQAALEVNHWCHEKATYLPSDSRTSSPMATILTATGRCGEESVLLVAALRCLSIPARQVYTPRWAHTDDNHAWVEAWIDGKWYFMGACEPEPVLNMAWFNEPASRAMLMHTKVFGRYDTDEDIITQNNCFTEINMIQNYVDTRKAVVRVEDMEGNPVENADVEFKIYNYAEFYSVTRQKSNGKGETSLTTGLGDLLAWASSDNKFGFAKICEDTTIVKLQYTFGDEFSVQLEVNPPVEGRIPVDVTQEQILENKKRLAYEDSIRVAYTNTFYNGSGVDIKALAPDGRGEELKALLADAKGNWKEILSFVENVDKGRLDEALDLLQNVSKKDLRDTPSKIFLSHFENTPDYNSIIEVWNGLGYNKDKEIDRDFYNQYLLSPRIAGENLSEYRGALKDAGFPVQDILNNPQSAILVFKERFSSPLLDEYNPQRISTTPIGVLKMGSADKLSRKIFIIALLRSCGVPARVDQVTGKPQYYKNGWYDIVFDDEQNLLSTEATVTPKGYLKATYNASKYLTDPQYYRHFTMAKVDNTGNQLLNFEEGDATEMGSLASWSNILKKGFEVETGYYLITSGTRTASGGVLANLQFSSVKEGKTSNFELVMPQNDDRISVLGYIDAEQKFLPEAEAEQTSILSVTGRGYFVVAILGAGDEPSNHAIRELESMSDEMKEWGRKMVVLAQRERPQAIENITVYGADPDNKVVQMIATACNGNSTKLPIIAIADSFGRVVYYSQGYNTSIRTQMLDVISKL